MRGKYRSPSRFAAATASRTLLRAAIRPLLRWRPLESPEPGYTVVMACNSLLSPMLGVNLRLLAGQKADNLRELILVFDRTPTAALSALAQQVRAMAPLLPIRFMYYSTRQFKVTSAIRWGWVYSWLSWCTGIGAARTRYVMLHDFDALLLRDNLLEERYAEIVRRQDQFVGTSFYEGNGVESSDRLATTFELILDAAFVRERFRPIEIFNYVSMFRGRSVDFDTFLYAQTRHGRSSVAPVAEEDMVHPSQMICQFTDQQRGRLPAIETNNLLLIPYFIYAGGDPEPLRRQHRILAAAMDGRGGRVVEYYGRPLDLSRLSMVHAQWLTKQAFRVERAVTGQVRDEVRVYFELIETMVGGVAGTLTSETSNRRAGEHAPVAAR